VLAPESVDNITTYTLGWYYSDHNSLESHVATTGFPYGRSESYEGPSGGLKRASGPEEALKMGSGHEAKAGTVAILNELDHYLSLRHYFTPNTATTLSLQGIKSVSVDVNGVESISFLDKEGQTLASCLSGSQYPPMTITGNISSWSNQVTSYLDIHVPVGGGNTPLSISGGGTVRVTDLVSGSVFG